MIGVSMRVTPIRLYFWTRRDSGAPCYPRRPITDRRGGQALSSSGYSGQRTQGSRTWAGQGDLCQHLVQVCRRSTELKLVANHLTRFANVVLPARLIDYFDCHPLDGYRRLTFMMLDEDVVALSPLTTYRVLSKAGRLDR